MSAVALRAAAVLPFVLCLGCSEAILSWTRFHSHSAFTDASHDAFHERLDAGEVTKTDVLATLGPPLQVIARDTGDVFVYRRRVRNTRIVNLNPAFVSFVPVAPPIPVFFGRFSSGYSDTLMVFFDAEGRLLSEGERFEIEGLGQALFGLGDRRDAP